MSLRDTFVRVLEDDIPLHIKNVLTNYEASATLAGGWVRDYFANLPAKDFDIFFNDREDFLECVSYFAETYAENFSPVIVSPTTITFWGSRDAFQKNVQFILREGVTRTGLLRGFDFECCCLGVFYNNTVLETVSLCPEAEYAAQEHRLTYNSTANSYLPGNPLVRMARLCERGWTCHPREVAKIVTKLLYSVFVDRDGFQRSSDDLPQNYTGWQDLGLQLCTNFYCADEVEALYDYQAIVDFVKLNKGEIDAAMKNSVPKVPKFILPGMDPVTGEY